MDGGQWALPHIKNRLQASSYQGTRVLQVQVQVQEPAGLASFQAFFVALRCLLLKFLSLATCVTHARTIGLPMFGLGAPQISWLPPL